jgi:SAM-dependent methyltransferase
VPGVPARNTAKEFWNARAREDAFHFVDNRLEYRNPDTEQFWRDGERDLLTLLGELDLSLASTDSVVEIGCGLGRLTRAIAARAADVRALDVSPEMLARAREHNAHLATVTWLEGDGSSLGPVESSSADACVSHVVFQHIPDPAITLGYVREIGRVLRPGGWAAFQVSNDPGVHSRRPGLRERARALAGRHPRGQAHPNWRGSAIEIDALRAAAADGGMEVERLVGEGTQYCIVGTRRR